jgi:predicted Fe-Mo cluster-binding NifX family protein
MKTAVIAIPTTQNLLDEHFGHCNSFTLFTVNNETIEKTESMDAPPHVPGKLPHWLAEKGVTDVIAGGMGQGAITIFNSLNINVFVGAPKQNPADIIAGFLSKTLVLNANNCHH